MEERYIFFDEPNHKYTDQYGNMYTSVTTAIGKCHVPFKTNYWAKKKAREFNTSEAAIKTQWKNVNKHSVDNGNKKHNALESAIKSTSKFSKAVNIITINNVKRCFTIFDLALYSDVGELSLEAFNKKIGYKYPTIYDTIKYYVDKGYKIYSEINVYDPINLISGTIDVLLVKDDKFVIIDWKTNRNDIAFESGYYKKDKKTNELTNIWVPDINYMLYPVDNLQDCTGIHYSLQLSMYANMVELFGYNLVAMILFHIRDSHILNQYGMPRKDEKGLYIKDDTKPEQVQYHIIRYLKPEVERLREYVGSKAIVNTQHKIIM
jgi:hypothetical protein